MNVLILKYFKNYYFAAESKAKNGIIIGIETVVFDKIDFVFLCNLKMNKIYLHLKFVFEFFFLIFLFMLIIFLFS